MKRLSLLFVLLALLALSARVFAQEESEGAELDYEEVVGTDEEAAQPTMSQEEMEARQKAQQALIRHLLTNLGDECREELQGYLQMPPEEQAANQEPFTPTCREEIQQSAMQFQQNMAGAAAGAGQQGREEGQGDAPAAPEPAEDNTATVAATLAAVLAGLLLPVGYAVYKHRAREAYLAAHPDVKAALERKQAAAAKKEAKERKRGKAPVSAE